MDPYEILGVDRAAVKLPRHLPRLEQRAYELIKRYRAKRQEYNVKRVEWAYEQLEKKASGEDAPEAAVPCDSRKRPAPALGPELEGSSAAPLAAATAAGEHASADAAQRQELIRQKLAARRQAKQAKTGATEIAPEEAPGDKRRSSVKDKFSTNRVCTQVPVIAEEECKKRVAKLALAPEVQLRRARLVCPLTCERIRTPARGKSCRHLQCFDLDAHILSKSSHCPVCGMEAHPPFFVLVDGYMAAVLASASEDVTEVTFDASGSWAAVVPTPPASQAAPVAESRASEGKAVGHETCKVGAAPMATAAEEVAQERDTSARSEAVALSGSTGGGDATAGSGAAANGATSSDAKAATKVVTTMAPPKAIRPKPPSASFAAQWKPQASSQSKEAQATPALEPGEKLVDPTDEFSYIVVELTRPMGIVFEAHPRTVGGVFVGGLEPGGPAAQHGRLKVGMQLVAVGGTVVKDKDLDACMDAIEAAGGKTVMLAMFRGTLPSLRSKGSAANDWIAGLAARVACGELEPSPPIEQRRQGQRRLSLPLSDSEEDGGGVADTGSDDAAWDSESGDEGELPQALAGLREHVAGAGLQEDLQSCLEALPDVLVPPGGVPQGRMSMTGPLVRAAMRACRWGNASDWDALDIRQRRRWRKASAKQLADAVNARVEQLERQKRESLQRQQAAAPAARAMAGGEARSPVQDGKAGKQLLKLHPSSNVQLDLNNAGHLMLSNVAEGPVAFRVRTSAPRSIVFHPVAGVVQRGGYAKMQIISTERCCFKVVVQAMVSPSGEDMSKEEWAKVAKEAMQETCLDVVARTGSARQALGAKMNTLDVHES